MRQLSLSDLDKVPIWDIIRVLDANGCAKEKIETIERKPVKLYDGFPVDCLIQINGEKILLILSGKREDVERVYFGVWNLNGTRGELHWTEDGRGLVWSNFADMEHFFYFQHFNKWSSVKHAWDFADRKMRELVETHKKEFDFALNLNDDAHSEATHE